MAHKIQQRLFILFMQRNKLPLTF